MRRELPCRNCSDPMRIQPGQRRRMCSSACRRAADLARQHGQAASAGHAESDSPAAAREQPPRSVSGQKVSRNRTPKPQPGDKPQRPVTASTCAVCQCSLPEGSSPDRRTCSARCRQQSYRDRTRRSKPTGTLPRKLAASTCHRCNSPFSRLPSSDWCSEGCWQQDLKERYGQDRCGICAASLAERQPEQTRRWCSSPCRQKALRLRKALGSNP